MRIPAAFRQHSRLILGFAALVVANTLVFRSVLTDIDDGIQSRSGQRLIDTAAGFADYVHDQVALIDAELRSVRHVYETGGMDAVDSFYAADGPSPEVITYFAIVGADGGATSVGLFPRKHADLSDRTNFKIHQGGGDTLYIGAPVAGKMTGEWIIPLSRPIHLADHQLGGMIAANVSPNLFSRYFDADRLGYHGVVALLGEDTIVRARATGSGQQIGTSAANSPMWDILGRADHGSWRQVSPVDGIERLYALKKIKDYPLIAVTGIAMADMESLAADSRHNAWAVYLASTGLLTVIFTLMLRHNSLGLAVARDRERLSLALDERQRQLSILEAARDLIASCDSEGRLFFLNEHGRRLLGIAPERHGLETLRLFDVEAFAAAAANGFWEGETELVTGDGRHIPVWQVVVAHRSATGLVEHFSTIARDLTNRRNMETELRLAANVLHSIAEAVVVSDTNATIVSVNPAFSEITGYTAEEAIGQTPRLIKSDRHDAPFYQTMWSDLTVKGGWQGQIWNRRKDGEAFLAWQHIRSVRDERGEVVRYVSVFSDITELHRKDEHIRHQAYHDALTGLPNRLLLQDRLTHAVEVARRMERQLAVMFIDLDRFKLINDSLGHDVGDLLLQQVAERLTASLRRSDTIARLGGDEFVVVLSSLDSPGEVAEVAEKIITQLVVPMTLKDHDVHVGASIGIAIFPQDGEDATTLMKEADTAMYRAKAEGRNTFRFFDPSMNGEAIERLELESALRRALINKEFRLYYQPKVDLDSGQVIGAEALIRWESPERGLVSPIVFIPLAEETGLIVRIGDWVLTEACRQLAEWRDAGLPPVPVAVNVSGRQFLSDGFADRIAGLLAEHGIDPGLLEVELTESVVMTNPEEAIIQLNRLREFGVAVSVDDFGTGYSSLSYLKRLPLNSIKVDRSFVHRVDLDSDNAAIVRAILGLGQALGMKIIAEGVETEGEERHLQDEGCPHGQGFKFARPLPAEEFKDWVKNSRAMLALEEAAKD